MFALFEVRLRPTPTKKEYYKVSTVIFDIFEYIIWCSLVRFSFSEARPRDTSTLPVVKVAVFVFLEDLFD